MSESITDQIIREIQEDPQFESKLEQQTVLENKMRGMGIDRHWNKIDKARDSGRETETKSVKKLLHYATEMVAEGINEFIESATGKTGPRHSTLGPLQELAAEPIALIACRVILDGVAAERRMTATSFRIANMIEDEIAYQQFKSADKSAYEWLRKREEKNLQHRPYDMTRKVMKTNMENRGIDYTTWSLRTKANVGTKLIDIVAQKTGLVKRVTRHTGKNSTIDFITATEETMKWIEDENSRSEIMTPVYLPTIVQPKPWTTPFDGGYWTTRVRGLTMIKTHNRPYLQELSELDMPDVYDALNAMQSTAWQVNQRILDTATILWRNGSTLGDIPKAENYDIPPKPPWLANLETGEYPREEWTEEHLNEFKQWKRRASDVHTANDQLRSLRLQLVKILSVSESFENEETIYFPHQMDFRGRAYAVPMFLNPQGSDLAKGMLTFANGVPIEDEEGRAWLAIHGANVFGYDKDSLEGRVQWVEENEGAILAAAEDPFNNRFWDGADDPFQFLAFCFEWQEFKQEGFGYVSTLPIQMDGSCNGLQNFSAALRDPVGGEAVNLIPLDKPADIYQRVADIVKDMVIKDAMYGDEENEEIQDLAKGWLKLGIDRKVCKRPVMTLAYGAKEFGFKDQVNVDTVKPAKLSMGEDFPWDHSGWPAAAYMGKLIWKAVARVVVAAREAMDWFQSAARIAAKEGLPIRWDTPDGLPVLQAYPKLDTKRIELTFGGVRMTMSIAQEQPGELKLDRNKQVNGIAPNWVHSMDASHMRETIRRCWAYGIRSLGLVHDSYGTHAGNAWKLAEELRNSFVDMYEEHDVLEEFKEELKLQLPEGAEIPELPIKGTLDLSRVVDSDFFFA